MKSKINSFFLVAFGILTVMVLTQSCEKEDEGCGEENISYIGGNESHNKGQDCMQCHKDGGDGEGCFIVAGTVYDSLQVNTISSGTVDFYTEPNGMGQKIKTVEIDGKGNFFTTDIFNLQGLYPVVTGPTGSKKYMGSPLTSGQCNSCHTAGNRIWVN